MDRREKESEETEWLKRYLALADIREFTYDVRNDILESFRFGTEKELFYRGTLADWEKELRGRVNREEEGQLTAFCSALREGQVSFTVPFTHNGLSRVVKGVTLEGNDGKKVYGVLMAGGSSPARDLVYKRASDRDPMLNMLNKKAILDYAQRACDKKEFETVYLVIFDLDNFKVVNDTYGHLFGDEVLGTVTDIINRAVGDHGMVGRIGGDEIMIVTTDLGDKAELRPILREIRSTVEETFKGKLKEISMTCCMGAAAYPHHGDSMKEVMDLADKMMYLAKEKGRNRYLIYTPEMHQDLFASPQQTHETKNEFAGVFDKIGIVQYMLEDYLKKGISSNETAFSKVGESFKLSEIMAVYERGKIGFRWTKESFEYRDLDLKWLSLEKAFFDRFDKNSLYVIDGLFALENKDHELLEKLKERDIQSALFYRLRNKGKTEGYILFAKKVNRQKWSEYELLALSTIAKIFEMSIYQ